jgi:hypothetical protein
VCRATGRPVAEQPAYTRREIDYPATVSSLVVSGMQFGDLKRRELLTLLGGAAAAWPLAARAQQPAKLPTVGFIGSNASAWSPWTANFVQRLRALGWIEGRTIVIEYRWSEGRPERNAEIDGLRVSCRAG